MRARLVWIPSFVVGAAAATAGVVAVALLLYAGEGMLRSLTLIVAVELVALGIGLAGPPAGEHWSGAVEALRRRWLSVLVSFLVASVFTVTWTFGDGFGADARMQALGLALLGGLPLYACGRLLAAIYTMSMVSTIGGRANSGAPAALGAALGVLVTGSSGLSRLGAPSLLLFFLIVLSGTALMQGAILEEPQAVADDGEVTIEAGPGSEEVVSNPESERGFS